MRTTAASILVGCLLASFSTMSRGDSPVVSKQELSESARSRLIDGLRSLGPDEPRIAKADWLRRGGSLEQDAFEMAASADHVAPEVHLITGPVALDRKSTRALDLVEGVSRHTYARAARALTVTEGRPPTEDEILEFIARQNAKIRQLNHALSLALPEINRLRKDGDIEAAAQAEARIRREVFPVRPEKAHEYERPLSAEEITELRKQFLIEFLNRTAKAGRD